MLFREKFPIRIRLLLVTVFIIVFFTSIYLVTGTQLIRADKDRYLKNYSSMSVKRLSEQLDFLFQNYAQKAKTLSDSDNYEDTAKAFFAADPNIVSYSKYQIDSGLEWKKVSEHQSEDYLKIFNVRSDDFSKLKAEISIPYSKVLTKGLTAWNGTLSNGLALISIGVSHVSEIDPALTSISIIEIKPDIILRDIASKFGTSYVVDQDGAVLAHPDVDFIKRHVFFSKNPVLSDALTTTRTNNTISYSQSEKKWTAAYSLIPSIGGYAVTELPEDQLFPSEQNFVRKTLLLGLLAGTVSLIIIILLSLSQSQVVGRLIDQTKKFREGLFIKPLLIKRKDDLGDLAEELDGMFMDVQERIREIDALKSELELKINTLKRSTDSQQPDKTFS